MRLTLFFVLLLLSVSCKREERATADSNDSSAPSAPSETPAPSVAASASATSSSAPSASPAPSASAAPKLPSRVAEIPAAWLACKADTECVSLPSACCGAWPANVAHEARVRAAVSAADAARGNCRNRVCAMRMSTPACDHGACVVR